MELITDLDEIKAPYPNAVITIGNFDGVHKGHQAILHQVIEHAETINGTSVAITFEPHPMKVLSSDGSPPLITLYEQKIELIEQTEAEAMARRLAAEEGICSGVSAAGALIAALRVAAEVRDATIVFIVCDRGDRYLSTGIFNP